MKKHKCLKCGGALGNWAHKIQKVHRESNGNVFTKVIIWMVKDTRFICNKCWNKYYAKI